MDELEGAYADLDQDDQKYGMNQMLSDKLIYHKAAVDAGERIIKSLKIEKTQRKKDFDILNKKFVTDKERIYSEMEQLRKENAELTAATKPKKHFWEKLRRKVKRDYSPEPDPEPLPVPTLQENDDDGLCSRRRSSRRSHRSSARPKTEYCDYGYKYSSRSSSSSRDNYAPPSQKSSSATSYTSTSSSRSSRSSMEKYGLPYSNKKPRRSRDTRSSRPRQTQPKQDDLPYVNYS